MSDGKRRIGKTVFSAGSAVLVLVIVVLVNILLSRTTLRMRACRLSSSAMSGRSTTNRIIRRFVAKGVDIAHITRKRLQEIEQWINCYPRKLLDYMSPNELYLTELKAIS